MYLEFVMVFFQLGTNCEFFSFVCLDFSSHSRIFHSYGDVTIAGEGMHILTYALYSWPLSSECSLACHIHRETRHPFIWSSPRTRYTHTYCRAVSSGAVTTYFYDLRLGFEKPTFRLQGQRSYLLRHRRGPG